MKLADVGLTSVRRNDWYKLKIDKERHTIIAHWHVIKIKGDSNDYQITISRGHSQINNISYRAIWISYEDNL